MKSRILKTIAMTTVAIISGLFLLKSCVAPEKLIKYSTSPDSSVRVEFLTEGYWGKSWVNVILDKPAKSKMTIYSETGNEVIFPNDINVFWSKDSSKFLAVSTRISSIPSKLNQTSSIQLESGEKLVLMYDIFNKVLWHNLYPQQKSSATPFQIKDIKQIEWHDCNNCK
jgi:hypothetical protein